MSRSEHFYQRSERCLCKANELREKGRKEEAERMYMISARWLQRANELREKGL